MQFVPVSDQLKPEKPRLVTSRHGLKWRLGATMSRDTASLLGWIAFLTAGWTVAAQQTNLPFRG